MAFIDSSFDFGNSSNSSSSGGFFSGLGLTNKQGMGVLGAGVAGGGLLYDLFKGDQPTPAEQSLTNEAAGLGGQGQSLLNQGEALQHYLETGTLPPELQAQLTLKQNAAKAALVQGAATRGQNTSPTQNSGLTQDINSLNLQTQALQGELEQQLFQAGSNLVSEGGQFLGMQANIDTMMAKLQEQQQKDTGDAIMSFAKALGGIFA